MTDIHKPSVLTRTAVITEKQAATDVRSKFIQVRDAFIANTGPNPQDGFYRWAAALQSPELAEYRALNKEVMEAIAVADAEAIKAALDEVLAEK